MCKTKDQLAEIDIQPKSIPQTWKDFAKNLYIIFWHELSMDPRVRRSPYHLAPENEVHLSRADVIYVRSRRVLTLAIHVLCVWIFYLICVGRVHPYTLLWSSLIFVVGKIGITAGAHRLWSHNAYKATTTLRFVLMIFESICFELSIMSWSRIHRVHHKYCDTDADPVNAARGFFFSHIGWLLILEHPDVTEKTKTIWLDDLKNDRIVMFQDRYYPIMAFIFAYVMPVLVPWYFWHESLWMCNLVPFLFTTVLSRHVTFTVNSIAHLYGTKPYNKKATSTETNKLISALITGEGWHNFHHAFPWDYRNSEFVGYGHNMGAFFVDLCAWLGLAYDLKTVSDGEIAKRVLNSGDGSHRVWGWKDEANTPDQQAATQISNQKID